MKDIKNIAVQIVLFGLAILLSLLFDFIQVEYVILAMVFLTILSLGNAFVIGYFVEDNIKTLEENIQLHLQDKTWLITQEQLLDLEKTLDRGSVWVISPDLVNDTGSSKSAQATREVVANNLEKGINYVFIVPNTNTIAARREELDILGDGKKGEIDFRCVDKNTFNSFSNGTHIVVFKEPGASQKSYLELPVEGKSWWVKMDENPTYDLFGNVKRLIDDSTDY